ncbi:MAG: beta-ketoacyl-[acyl-carrier-protein] synthase family protein [Acetobacteraceae bacterium]|nr:beta-ketoacyl-[acyl-carrier-protein] synthase family protein [Acetobacteraceae bacterium]
MSSLTITACTVVSAIGRGLHATFDALRDRRSGLVPCDFGGVTIGYVGRVPGLESRVLPAPLAFFDCRNNRLAQLALETDGFAEAVARARSRYGDDRIGVVVGTSTSGILSSEEAYRRRDAATGALPRDFNAEGSHDMYSLGCFVRAALGLRGPALVVSTACASSGRAFVDADHLLRTGICDAVVVGGADTLCRMTLRGFAALELISPVPCRPCDAERSGLSIGEAAGFMLLERDGAGPRLLGYGVSSDGHHMSAPHPEAAGAIAAMRGALSRAGLRPAAIDYVNLHGTGTRANDAMEDRAMQAVFGAATPCSSTKGWSGHTLGAAGVLEAAVALLCLRHGLVPGCLGVETVDQAFGARIVTANAGGPVRRVMSNSFGFGGSNCSLIFGAAS